MRCLSGESTLNLETSTGWVLTHNREKKNNAYNVNKRKFLQKKRRKDKGYKEIRKQPTDEDFGHA